MARPSPGARRVAAVLEFLAARPRDRFTLSELSRQCRLNKATAHALLTELTATGLLLRHPDEKRYSLGPRLVGIGRAAEQGYRGQDFQSGPLHRLSGATGTVAVTIALEPGGDEARLVGSAGVSERLPIPVSWSLAPPQGAVFLAWADQARVEAWLARSPAADAVQHAVDGLRATRVLGAAIGSAGPEWSRYLAAANLASKTNGASPAEDNLRDVLADLAATRPLVTGIDDRGSYDIAYIAAPVFDAGGEVDLAIAVGWPEGRRCTGTELRSLTGHVIAAADEITSAAHGIRPVVPDPDVPGPLPSHAPTGGPAGAAPVPPR